MALLRFDPIVHLKISCRLFYSPTWSIVTASVAIIGVAVAAAASDGLLYAGDWSAWADIQQTVGAVVTDYQPATMMPLFRDVPTLLIILSVPFMLFVARRLVNEMAACVPVLMSSKVIRWRSTPAPVSRQQKRIFSKLRSQHPRLDSQALFQIYVDQKLSKLGRSEKGAVPVAAAVAAAIHWIAHSPDTFVDKQASTLSLEARNAAATQTSDNWWASYAHLAGASCYLAIATLIVFVIIVQNLVASTAAICLFTLPAYARLDFDWLNADGNFGWDLMRRVYKLVYISLALRGVGIALLFLALGFKFPWFNLIIAVGWLAFIIAYVVLPYRLLNKALSNAQERRMRKIERFARKAVRKKRSAELQLTDAYRTRIDAVRSARANPLGIPKIQASSLLVTALLPTILTVFQIVLQ